MWQHFKSLKLSQSQSAPTRQRYSVTADILAFEECSIQYGAFSVRRYEPALMVQRFYGSIIHQVLDRAHAHFRGDFGAPKGTLPTDDDIEIYLREAEKALVARRIQSIRSSRDHALKVLKRFNSLEGPTLYPRILETECRLQSDQVDYILHGNVDVLARTEDQESYGVEIWDYKGTNKPSLSQPEYQRYVFQMQVYSDLYRQKTGIAPTKAVLYFLGELAHGPKPTSRPVNALLQVDLNPREVQDALNSFAKTVKNIEKCRTDRHWPDPATTPSKATCDACDLRWSCSAAAKLGRKYPLRYP